MQKATYSERLLKGGQGVIAWQRLSRFRKASEEIRSRVPSGRCSALLDIGAADGIGLPFLKPLAKRVLSVNYYENHTREFRAAHPNDEVITADVRSLPLDDGEFDIVVSFETLHLLPTWEDRAQAMREISRVLRKAGLFVFSVPQETGYPALIKYCARALTGNNLHGMTLRLALMHWLASPMRVEALDKGKQVGFNVNRFVRHAGAIFEVIKTRPIPFPVVFPMNLLVVARKP